MKTFEDAFIKCLKDGVYPGPSNINERKIHTRPGIYVSRSNKLNGRETRRRVEMMYDFGIPYQRGQINYTFSLADDGYPREVEISNAGAIPNPDHLTPDWFNAGWRKHEIMNPDEPWKLRRK